jgi:hypothetical protein
MEQKKPQTHALKGFRLLQVRNRPRMAVLALNTETGPLRFPVTRQVLLRMAEAFREQAEKMPEGPPQQKGGSTDFFGA